MTPMPAAEVRRRGTRIRRRNNALAAVGGLAVVAAIATPFAVFAGSQGSSELQPTEPVSWKQEIPDGFPLAAGMPDGTRQTDAAAFDLIAACGTTAWNNARPRTVDVAGASQADEGSSGTVDRTLALYADDTTANEVLAGIQEAISSCPEDGSARDPIINEVVDSDLGTDASFVFTQQARDGDLLYDLSVFQFARSGNALYVASTHTSAGGDELAATEVQRMADSSSQVLDELCVFSAAGCQSDPDQAEDTADQAATSIPADFDILAGLPPETDQRFGPQGPARDMEDIDLTACGQEAPFPSTVDRLRLDFNQAVGQRQRQLMVFTDEDTAESWLTDASSAFVGCEDDGGNGVVGRYDVIGSDLGAAAATVTLRHYVDGEPGLGYEITELVRVGAAVLVARTSIDGSNTVVTDEVLTDLVATSQAEINPVVDAMCIFDPTRC